MDQEYRVEFETIRIRNSTKTYGDLKAVDDVTFHVHTSEISDFLGPNSAGKTTAVRIITSYLHPTSGWLEVGGLDVPGHSLEVRNTIGYLPENAY